MGTCYSFDPEIMKEFQKRIDAVTGGRLKFEVLYDGEYPYKGVETLRALSDGTADAITASHMNGGDEPRLRVSTAIPFLIPRGDFELDRSINRRLTEESAFLDIFRDWNGEYLSTFYVSPQDIEMKNTLVRSPEDLKGRKIRVPHAVSENWIKAMGGDPVHIAWSETYTALATGLVEGVQTSFSGAYGTGLVELCPYITYVHANQTPYRFIANKDSLAALPADVREAFVGALNGDIGDWWGSLQVNMVDSQLVKSMFELGTTVTTIPQDWREELRADAYNFSWKPLLDDAGPAGWEMFDVIAKILISEGYEVPGYTPK